MSSTVDRHRAFLLASLRGATLLEYPDCVQSAEGCREKSAGIVQWFLVFLCVALPLQVKKEAPL